jgi:hypothetical protein
MVIGRYGCRKETKFDKIAFTIIITGLFIEMILLFVLLIKIIL